MFHAISRTIFLMTMIASAILAFGTATTAQANSFVNGDFEDTTGWGAPGTMNFPVGWDGVIAGKVNGAAQQAAPNAIGGNTSAFISKDSYYESPEWGLSQNIPSGVYGDWQFDMDFASEMPTINQRSINFYLAQAVVTVSYQPSIALSLWNIDGTGRGDIKVYDSATATTYTVLNDAVIFDDDVQVTPLVNHMRVCGHYDLATPTYDIILTDSNGIDHSVMGLAYYYRTAPVTGDGIKDIEFLTYKNLGDYVIDNLSITSSVKPGDADRNGKVDEEDAATMAANWLAGGANWTMGDFNDDGKVDDKDATLMATNWQGGSAASVPEPSAIMLLCAGFVMLFLRRRR